MKKTLGILLVMLCATPMIYAQADGIVAHESSDVEMTLNGAVKGKVIASGSCGKNVNYELYDDYTLRIFGNGAMTNYDHTFSDLGTNSPWGTGSQLITKIKTVVIEDGVTRIGAHIFMGCSSLIKVIIPNSVTSIGHEAFRDCGALTKIDIPNSVTTIGTGAFENCTSLVEVNLPNDVETIDNYVFRGCSSLVHITIPNSVTSIEGSAFFDCISLEDIIIPDGVTYIGWDAFCNCHNMKYVKIGKGVTTIDEAAFFSNNDREIVVEIASDTHITLIGPTANSFGYDDDITFYVPETTLSGYRYSEDWVYYKNRFVGYDSTTGIISVGNGRYAINANVVYDLQGRKVSEMRPNRIYIVNGKKVMK